VDRGRWWLASGVLRFDLDHWLSQWAAFAHSAARGNACKFQV